MVENELRSTFLSDFKLVPMILGIFFILTVLEFIWSRVSARLGPKA